ncbi:hypothetical protein DDE01_02930 [Desulfovibrio desulfuricans]|nr:hypothetical protein DDE01_02930 [Desulfovibrio desulfuricans]
MQVFDTSIDTFSEFQPVKVRNSNDDTTGCPCAEGAGDKLSDPSKKVRIHVVPYVYSAEVVMLLFCNVILEKANE